MQKLLFTEATDAQLRSFAIDVQQLDKVPSDRVGIIAALLESGYTPDYIFIAGEETPAATASEEPGEPLAQYGQPQETPAEMPTSGFGYWRDAPMVTCRIMSTDRPGGNEPAHPSINGSPPLVIQRNKLVRIPWDFYLVLKQAGGTKLVPGADATDDLIRQDYKEYPMTDEVLPTRAAVVAWEKLTGDDELGKPKAARAA